MEEIVTALNNISEILTENELPRWLTLLDIVLPVLLTGITIVLSVRMDRQNMKLQKQIHNRDVANQTRQAMMDIFRSFFDAYDVAIQPGEFVASVFVSDKSYYQWGLSIEATSKDLTLAFNKARLLIGDDVDLIDYLKKCWLAFRNINDAVHTYVNLGIPAKTVAITWNIICQQNDITREDYLALLKDPALAEKFKKMCDNSYTQDIQNKIKIYTDLLESGEFQEKFRKYIQIKELK